MRRFLADTSYLIALLFPRDQLHKQARDLEAAHPDAQLVTSDAVIMELLAYVSGLGSRHRQVAIAFVDYLRQSPNSYVVRMSASLFDEGFELYRRRPDKGYSLADCISMVVCGRLGIDEVATSDNHFKQEGFTILLHGRR